ncbi:MAG: ribosomal protein [Chlamydiales bacterium]|jgi:small subunit ribosomal protein S8|nr:ribosomal protein [Chlamydiales bacterium]
MAAIIDPIADLLTRIRNGCMAKNRFIDVPLSKMKLTIVDILKAEGFVENYLVKEEKPQGTIRIFLKYTRNREPIIRGLQRVSHCGRRQYIRCRDIPQTFGGMGLSIISTSRGVMSDRKARENNLGGEFICRIW